MRDSLRFSENTSVYCVTYSS